MNDLVEYDSKIELLSHLPGMHYICVPDSVLKQLGGGFKHRVLCTLNNSLTFQAGVVSLGNEDGYITVSKARMKSLNVKQGDVVSIQLQKDHSEFGMDVSEELQELLSQDREGDRRFRMLTPGKQRYIIHYVNSVKSSEKRLQRAMLLIGNLKQLEEGNEQFRNILGKN